MPFPAATIGSMTATGDIVLPPCNPKVLAGGMPVACIGDMVLGPVINVPPGGVIITGNFKVFVGGRPIARVTSSVAGAAATPFGPVPVGSVIVMGAFKVLA